MAARLVNWDRLVRYIGADGPEVRYGEPAIKDSQVGEIAELAKQGKLHVNVLEGDDVWSAKRTGRTEIAARLLGPLTKREVPIIRCIGLNYTTHSMYHAVHKTANVCKVLETGRPLPTCPTVFAKPGPAVADHDADIPIPCVAQSECGCEGELVVLIGKDAKNVSAKTHSSTSLDTLRATMYLHETGNERPAKLAPRRSGRSASRSTSMLPWGPAWWQRTF